MEIRVAGTVDDSIVDGPGFRFTVFTQGCPHHCPGCHNPQTHDFAGGKIVDTDDLIARMRENLLLDGLTLSGGEPFEQVDACLALANGARALGLSVWIYSGYTFEQLLKRDHCLPLLRACDVLIDGSFLIGERTLELPFRGSKNQRLVDLQPALLQGRAILYAGGNP